MPAPFLDATALADMVRTGASSPAELVDDAIDRIEALNPVLNAVIHPLYDRARAEAAAGPPDGPFRGVPVVVKDLDGILAGAPAHMGSKFLKAHGHVGDVDSYLFAKLRAAGFIVVGKTNTPEFGLQPTTEPEAYGPTRNPWDTTRSTGGSSGGSAAAVASGMVPVGHAGDGGGSIRIPASECGLVGLKPTRGRNSLGPAEGESWAGMVVRLAVTRSVRDTAGVLDAVAGAMPGDPYSAPPPVRPYSEEVGADPGSLRIGVRTSVPGGAAELHPDCERAVRDAAALLESLGHHVDDVAMPALDDEGLVTHFTNCLSVWTAHDLEEAARWVGREVTEADVEYGTWLLAQIAKGVSATQYLAGLEYLRGFSRRVAAWWADGGDLLLTPVITEPPPALGQFRTTAENPLQGLARSSALVPFTVPFNVTGQPAISLPLHWNGDGLPIGVQLVAAFGREDLLLRVAAQLEEARPWAERTPPTAAAT